MEFYEKETFGGDQKLFTFWFNTSFALEDPQNPAGFSVEIAKEGLDKAHKDKNNKIFHENFKVICQFQSLDGTTKFDSSPDTLLSDLALDEQKESISNNTNSDEGRKASASLTLLTDKYPSLKNF